MERKVSLHSSFCSLFGYKFKKNPPYHRDTEESFVKKLENGFVCYNPFTKVWPLVNPALARQS